MGNQENGIEPTGARYAFGDTEAAAARLALLAEVFEPPSRSLLKWVDPRTIEIAVDLGCGPGHSTNLLSSLNPEVLVGIDASPAFLDRARSVGPPAANWYRHDVTSTPLPSGPADVLYARLLLAHLARPEDTVLGWLHQLRPGGYLVVEEDEFVSADVPTLTAYEELSASLVAHRGGDLYVGRRLKQLEVSEEYQRIVDRVYRHHVPVPVAAELFGMNFAVWRHEPWVAAQRGIPWLDAMERALARLASSEEEGSVVFAIRQILFRRTPTAGPDHI